MIHMENHLWETMGRSPKQDPDYPQRWVPNFSDRCSTSIKKKKECVFSAKLQILCNMTNKWDYKTPRENTIP